MSRYANEISKVTGQSSTSTTELSLLGKHHLLFEILGIERLQLLLMSSYQFLTLSYLMHLQFLYLLQQVCDFQCLHLLNIAVHIYSKGTSIGIKNSKKKPLPSH